MMFSCGVTRGTQQERQLMKMGTKRVQLGVQLLVDESERLRMSLLMRELGLAAMKPRDTDVCDGAVAWVCGRCREWATSHFMTLF